MATLNTHICDSELHILYVLFIHLLAASVLIVVASKKDQQIILSKSEFLLSMEICDE